MPRQAAAPPGSIAIVWEGREIRTQEGMTIDGLARSHHEPSSGWKAPVAAILDGRLVSLGNILYDGAEVRLVRSWSGEGREVYRRSLAIVMQAALRIVHPGVRLVVGQSLGGGIFHSWEGEPRASTDTVHALEIEMHRLVDLDAPLELKRVSTRQAMRLLRERGLAERALLLETWWHETVRLVRLGDYIDVRHGPVAPSTGRLPHFSLVLLRGGLLLRFPESGRDLLPVGKPRIVKALFDVFRETSDWNRILGVSTVGQLNKACLTEEVNEIIKVSEGLHEHKVVHIAERILERGGVKLTLVAGPSSSGKTSFAKRLAVQLRVLGVNPVSLSVDDYYVDRDRTPVDSNGRPDFEAIEAVDLDMFNQHLGELLGGREVMVPRYDFPSGRRVEPERWGRLRVGPNDLLIVEGIHALNPRLTQIVPQERKFGVYVSALAQLGLDDANRISTTDVRLVRRIVRDRLFRGYSATQTLRQWPSVKRGEARNIFPYQDRADAMFNSTLVYELAVLKLYAQRFLLDVPHEAPEFIEAYRLLKFLDVFVGVEHEMVPRTSIIREFIGGSHFRY